MARKTSYTPRLGSTVKVVRTKEQVDAIRNLDNRGDVINKKQPQRVSSKKQSKED
jgi:hypothetical protein